MIDLKLPSRGVQAVLARVAGAESYDLPHEWVMRVVPLLPRDLCDQVLQVVWVV